MRSSEIRLRKLKLRLRDKHFANHKAPCTAIWRQPIQSVLALRGRSATDLIKFNVVSDTFSEMICDKQTEVIYCEHLMSLVMNSLVLLATPLNSAGMVMIVSLSGKVKYM